MRATEGIKNALRAGYDAVEHATFIDDEGLDLLPGRDVPAVPALQFEWASAQYGKDYGMSQRVLDGHQETLEGGAESARRISQSRRTPRSCTTTALPGRRMAPMPKS